MPMYCAVRTRMGHIVMTRAERKLGVQALSLVSIFLLTYPQVALTDFVIRLTGRRRSSSRKQN